MGLFASLYNGILRCTQSLAWGPTTDPSKIMPVMDQYTDWDWPEWCRAAKYAPELIQHSFLKSLPEFYADRWIERSIVDVAESIRLRILTHYKNQRDWNHEFIRADFVYQTGTTEKKLIAVWERGLPDATFKDATKRGIALKSNFSSDAVDRVWYITEDGFKKFVEIKKAFKLRTAEFPELDLNYLQVAAVLEQHSVLFPAYCLYSTMCYWYADSTYEVLVGIGAGKEDVEKDAALHKGQYGIGPARLTTYGTGVTREAAKQFMAAAAATDDAAAATSGAVNPYERYMVESQGRLMDKETKAASLLDKTEDLTPEERKLNEETGWNVAWFLRLIRKMPEHEALLVASKNRHAKVLTMLEEIQRDRLAKDALEKEAQKRALEEMAKWKATAESCQEELESLRRQMKLKDQ